MRQEAGSSVVATARAKAAILAVAVVWTLAGCGSSGTPNPTSSTRSSGQFVLAGLAALKRGDLTLAREDFVQAANAQPRNLYARFDLGVVDQHEKHYQAALADYQAALKINPRYTQAIYNSAVITSMSNPARAITLYQTIIRQRPRSPLCYFNIAVLQIGQGRKRAAAKALATAVSQAPSLASRLTPGEKHLLASQGG